MDLEGSTTISPEALNEVPSRQNSGDGAGGPALAPKSDEKIVVDIPDQADTEEKQHISAALRAEARYANQRKGPVALQKCTVPLFKEHDEYLDSYKFWPREFAGVRHGILATQKLLAFRGAMLVSLLLILFGNVYVYADEGYAPWYLIYLSHWALLLQIFYFLGAMYCNFKALKVHVVQLDLPSATPWFVYLTVHLFGVACPSSLFICIMYWLLVYPDQVDPVRADVPFVHGVNVIIQLLDFVMSGQRLYVTQVLDFLFLGISYTIFSLIYWAADGVDHRGRPRIYGSINWEEEPTAAAILVLLMLLIAVPLLFGLCFGTAWARRAYGPYRGRKEAKAEIENANGAMKEQQQFSEAGAWVTDGSRASSTNN